MSEQQQFSSADVAAHGTFGAGRAGWLGQAGHVRNLVRQEMIARQLDRHLGTAPRWVLDVGAGQGAQSIRLARAGHRVYAAEPDAAMRRALAAALADEPDDVRDRVTVLDAGWGSIAEAAQGRCFDAVLLLGVLMYVPSSQPVITELAERVYPGGLLAVATRTATSALWRPAARQDWPAALAAFAEDATARAEGRDVQYVNEIGAPARADDFDKLVRLAAAAGLSLEEWYGVRIAVDMAELDPAPPTDSAQWQALLEVEDRLGAMDPYRQLAQLAHFIFRRQP